MRIHWFSFTVFSNEEHARSLWARHFENSLGLLVDTERKGRGFENIDTALNEAKLYYNPTPSKKKEDASKDSIQLSVQRKLQEINKDMVQDATEDQVQNIKGLPLPEYYHIEITGSACDCVVPTIFRDVFQELTESGLRFNIKRVDFAFDEMPFSPTEFCAAIIRGNATTLAKRETLSIVQTPYMLRDNGVMGSDTCYIGSKNSSRFIRVYNQRGATRLEFVCKDDRADAVCADIFEHLYGDWDYVARENLVQFITFDEMFPQWEDFIKNAQSADIKISSARVVALSKMENWLDRQVGVTLSVFYDVWGPAEASERIKNIVHNGNNRDRSRYKSVLQLANTKNKDWPKDK